MRRRKSFRPAIAALLLLLGSPLLAQATGFSGADFDEAASMILCDCGCHPQAVKDCACGRAGDMRREIADLVRQGMTGEGIIALYVERHGEKIRIAPSATGFNLVAWLGPLVGLVLATAGMFWLLHRWSRDQEAPPESLDISPAPPVDGRYQERLRQALRNLE